MSEQGVVMNYRNSETASSDPLFPLRLYLLKGLEPSKKNAASWGPRVQTCRPVCTILSAIDTLLDMYFLSLFFPHVCPYIAILILQPFLLLKINMNL